MCGRSLKGFSPSWATSQAVGLLAQEELHQRPQWENPGKNTATETRRRKFGELLNTWMPENDLKSLVINRLTQLEYKRKVQDTFDPTGFIAKQCFSAYIRAPVPVSMKLSSCLSINRKGALSVMVTRSYCCDAFHSLDHQFHTTCHPIVQKWTWHLGEVNFTKKTFKFVCKRWIDDIKSQST